MKKYIKQILTLTVLSFLVFSCDTTDDYTGDSIVNFSKPTVQYNLDAGNDITLDEMNIDSSNGVYTIVASIPEPLPIDLNIDITQTGGTMTGEDFEVSNIFIPAYTTTGSGTVTFFKTGNLEGDETLELTTNTNSPNANGSESYSFTMTNDYVNDVMAFTFDWSGSYTYEPVDGAEITLDYCAIDFDFYIIDSGFNFIPPWDAATGSCPESFELMGLADGTYYLVSDLYANNFSGTGVGQELPITVSYTQEYFDSGSFVYSAYTTDDSSGMYLMGQVDVANSYEYTVTGF